MIDHVFLFTNYFFFVTFPLASLFQLEDGEVDLKKSRLFLDCFKQELRKVSSSQPSDTEFHFADALGFSKSEKDEEDTLDELLAV